MKKIFCLIVLLFACGCLNSADKKKYTREKLPPQAQNVIHINDNWCTFE